MATDSESRKKKEYLDKEVDVIFAAICLVTMKHSKIDKKSVLKLRELTSKTIGKKKHNKVRIRNSIINRETRTANALPMSRPMLMPLPGASHDDQCLPCFPPVECLRGLVRCYTKSYRKQLTNSDVKEHLSRLQIAKEFAIENYLPMLKEEDDIIKGIKTTVYDSNGQRFNMEFKCWSGKLYVLTTKAWNDFVFANCLEGRKDVVTLWMFRHAATDELCFLITSRRENNSNNQVNNQVSISN